MIKFLSENYLKPNKRAKINFIKLIIINAI